MNMKITTAAAAVLVAFAMGTVFSMTRCHPAVPPAPPAHVEATASAQVVAQAIATTSVRITIKKSPMLIKKAAETKVASQFQQATFSAPLEGEFSGGPVRLDPQEDEEIVITIDSVAIATSSAAASSSAAMPIAMPPDHREHDHTRLGVIVGVLPGIVALDFEAWRFDLLGSEVGLDVQANLIQVGAGVSFGSKVFGTAGGWTAIDLSRQGWYAAVGLRF